MEWNPDIKICQDILLLYNYCFYWNKEKIGWKSTTGQNDHVNDYFICNTE